MYGIDKWRSTSGRLLPTGQQKIDESETGYYLVAEIVNILCDEKYLADDGKPALGPKGVIVPEMGGVRII